MSRPLERIGDRLIAAPAIHALSRLIEEWRTQLPKVQEWRYRSNGSQFLAKAANKMREAIHAFDRAKELRKRGEKMAKEITARSLGSRHPQE